MSLIGAVVIVTSGDFAEAQTRLPGPAEPGRIQRPFEPPESPAMRPEADVEPSRRSNMPPENADELRFVLRGLSITGVTVYAEDEFKSLIEPKIGQEISLADLYELSNAITARYGADGYILSQALIPAQRIENGIARIEVVEGSIDQITFDGNAPKDVDLMHRIAAHIREAQPLTAAKLERYLLLMGDLPGYKVRGVLIPSTTEGASDLIIEVDHKPVQAVGAINNRGTRYIGPIQIQAGAKLNNAAGFHEGLGLNVLTTGQPDELKSVGLSFERPISSDGTNLTVAVGKSYVAPGYTLKSRDIDSDVTSYSVGVSHHVLRSRAQNLAVRLDFDAADIETNENGGRTPLSEDHVRSVRVGARYDLLDTLVTPAFTSVTGKVSQGVDVFGASNEGAPLATRSAGDPTYTKLNMEIQRLQTLGEGFNLLLGGTSQYSFSKLLSPEEFGVGGEEYGRGFDPSEFSGDHGLAGKVELQYGGEGGVLPVADWQLYGFYDFGAIWNKDPAAEDSSRHTLASTGGGLRFNVNPNLSGYIEIAKPVINRVHAVSEGEGKDPRLFLGVVGKF